MNKRTLFITAATVTGVVPSTGHCRAHRRPASFLHLHRWLGALSVLFLLTHMGALIGDNDVDFDILTVVVPFASDWKTWQIALGVFALWGLIIVGTASLAMQRLPTNLWRGINFTSYLTFLLTSFAGTFSGTDATNKMPIATSITTTAALVPAVSYRTGTRKAVRARAGSTSVLEPSKHQAAPNISRHAP